MNQSIITTDTLRKWQQNNNAEQVLNTLPDGASHPDPEVRLIYGICCAIQGQGETAGMVLTPLLEGFDPESKDAKSDLGLACLLLGQTDAAADLFDSIIANASATAVDYSRMGLIHLAQLRLEESRICYAEAVKREPGRAEWHNNLGGILVRLQLLEEALEQYDIALQCNPELPQATQSRLKVLNALDRTGEVVEELEKQLKAEPDQVDLRVRLARAYELDNQLFKSANVLKEAFVQPDAVDESDCPDQLHFRQVLADLMIKRGQNFRGLRLLEAAERFSPDPAIIIAQQAVQWAELGNFDKALETITDALAVDPDNLTVKTMEARVLSESGDFSGAESCLRLLLEIYPGDARLMIQLGQTLMWVGKLDEASEYFEQASRINPMALVSMADSQKLPEDPKSIAMMENLAKNPLLDARARSDMAFSVSRIHDKTKKFDQAAYFLDLANSLANRTLNYQPESFSRKVDAVLQTFNRSFFDHLPKIRQSNRTVIFVVGMPRSGTTLTEQILSSHPEVFGAGELPYIAKLNQLMPRVLGVKKQFPFCAPDLNTHHREEAARYYLHQLDLLGVDTPYVVDKMPHNFLSLGVIAMIFPNAVIVNVNRDPRDIAVSNYQQNFKARHGGLGYAFNLEHIARQINDYQKLMNHWREVLPLPIFDLSYEEMVEDMEGTSKKLLDAVGVSWHEDLKHFYETKRAVRTASVTQVRQPIYTTSMKKWKRYENYLDNLLDHLNPEVTQAYDNPTANTNPYKSRIIHQGRIISFEKAKKPGS